MRKIFIDCGTHMGMGFSRISDILDIDHEWETFGFEANPLVYNQYIKNIQSGNYPPLNNKNITLENKAVWINNGHIDFSLRGITEHHFDNVYKDGKDESNPFYKESWEPGLCNMVAKDHGLKEEEILNMPWDGGSTVTEIKGKIKGKDIDKMYKWHENVKVESIDLSQWIKENFKEEDFIAMKMDIEGAEYTVLPKMIEDDTIKYINYAFIEWHDWFLPEYKDKTSKLKNSLRDANVQVTAWY